MPATLAIHQYDTFLTYDTGGGPIELAEVKKITPPKKKGAMADATHLRSPNFTKEMIASWKDSGTSAAVLNFRSDSHNALTLLADLRTTVTFALNLPLELGKVNRATVSWVGQVTTCSLGDFEIGDKVVETELEFTVIGGIIFTPAS